MEDFRPKLSHPYFFIRKNIYEAIRTHAPKLKGNIMDFGCGSKPYRHLFNCSEYIGVDYINEGHSHENESIDVYYDGKKIPLADDRFDGVLASEVFEHVFNLPEILREINRVMKKDGLLLATCPFVWKEHEVPNDYARYTIYALEDILTKAGFRKVLIERGGNFSEVIFQLRVLFFFDKFYGKVENIPVLKQLFTFLFILMPNIAGNIISKIFQKNKQMYLSNIVLFQKC